MYRVYDLTEERWVQDVYMSPYPNNKLYKLKKSLFGHRLIPVDEGDYIIHKFIDLYDKDGDMVYEGDIIEAQIADDEIVTGVVAYATEWSSYFVWCSNPDKFYVLGDEICQFIKVLGNVFDTPHLTPEVKIEDDLNG